MSRRPKKRCAVCGQDIVPDPLVDPGNPPHRHQACTTAHPTRAHHRMVTLAKSSPSRSTPRPSQNDNATVMLTPVAKVFTKTKPLLALVPLGPIAEKLSAGAKPGWG